MFTAIINNHTKTDSYPELDIKCCTICCVVTCRLVICNVAVQIIVLTII